MCLNSFLFWVILILQHARMGEPQQPEGLLYPDLPVGSALITKFSKRNTLNAAQHRPNT